MPMLLPAAVLSLGLVLPGAHHARSSAIEACAARAPITFDLTYCAN